MHVKMIMRVFFFNILFLSIQTALFAQSPVKAVKDLLSRIVPDHAAQFQIEIIDRENNKDVFEIETMNNKIVLRGNNGVAIASALYYYLNRFCYAQITWNGINMKLPATLPTPTEKIHRSSPYKYRYYLNYCT